jgi:8-oxo-dGTP pyrophosphatase MutT (NUDIX family)
MAKDKDFPEILSKDESVNIQKADPNAPASEPKPAATVLLVRAPLEAVEVFMIKRNAKTNFGGAWVFPGGKLDPVDSEVEINSFCSGLTDEMASQILGLEEGGLNYWIACIRECFEECGVLLAYRENGDFFGASDDDEMDVLNAYQDRLNKGEPVLLELCKKLNIKLAVDRLAYVSHWVTPKMEMRRYSTRFFIAIAPEDQDAIHDGSEGVESIWISPEEALKKGDEGDFPIILPTIKNLESIVGFTDTHSLLKTKVDYQNEVSCIEPKFFMKDGKLVGLLPGDIGYEDH